MRSIGARALIAGAALSAAAAMPALADFKVQTPDAETGEFAIEPLGDYGHDPLAAHNGELSSTQEFEYGVNGFWRTELELEQGRDAGPGQSIHFSQVTSENMFQFTERGEYWVDAGFFAEFGKTTLAATPNETTFGPIFRKELLGTINTVNLFMEKDIGTLRLGAARFSVRLGDAHRSRHADRARVPGLWPAEQLSGATIRDGHEDNRIGPQLFGTITQHRPGQPQMERRHLVRRRPMPRRAKPFAGRPNTKSTSDPFLDGTPCVP